MRLGVGLLVGISVVGNVVSEPGAGDMEGLEVTGAL